MSTGPGGLSLLRGDTGTEGERDTRNVRIQRGGGLRGDVYEARAKLGRTRSPKV